MVTPTPSALVAGDHGQDVALRVARRLVTNLKRPRHARQRQPGVSVTYTDLRVLERASFGSTWVMKLGRSQRRPEPW